MVAWRESRRHRDDMERKWEQLEAAALRKRAAEREGRDVGRQSSKGANGSGDSTPVAPPASSQDGAL